MMNLAAKLGDLETVKTWADQASDEDAERSLSEKTDVFKMLDGSTRAIQFADSNFKAEYKDEYTAEVLPRHLVRAAMIDELTYFNQHVWKGVDAAKVRADHLDPIRTRWVICNKGDAEHPEIRARLVACEVNHYNDDSGMFYAATPPLEAKRMVLSEFATRRRTSRGEPLQLSFLDITKAYFNGVPNRPLSVRLPKELGLPPNVVGSLQRCMYGTRDAGSIWEETYATELEKLGFTRGKASPCCFHHARLGISLVVHGDDFTAVGTKASLDEYEAALQKRFELKIRGRLGEGKECLKEIRILNRIVRIDDFGPPLRGRPPPLGVDHQIIGSRRCYITSHSGRKGQE